MRLSAGPGGANAPAPRDGPTDPTRHLWQLPVLLLGIGAFVSTWQGWLPVGPDDPATVFVRYMSELKATYEKVKPDPVELKKQLTKVAEGVEAYPDKAALARFYLGSGYVRLAELTEDPDEARGYWTLAHQHFGLVPENQLGDPADAAKYAFRKAKATARVGLAPYTSSAELVALINVLLLPQPGEEAGETQRIIADLALRQNPPDYARAKLALTEYVKGGISTPAASRARGRLQLGHVYLLTHDPQDNDLARKELSQIGADAPPEVLGQAKAELAQAAHGHRGLGRGGEGTGPVAHPAGGAGGAAGLNAAYQLGLCKQHLREPEEAARLFEEAAKGEGLEAQAAAIQLASLHLQSTDRGRHKAAVALLAGALKDVQKSADYDPKLVPLNEVQAAFELALTVLVNDGEHESALGAAEIYAKVSAPGRSREKRAEVLGKWGEALKGTLSDPRPKFQEAAAEFAAMADDPQLKTDGKLNMLRRSAHFSRLAEDPKTAAARLVIAVKLPEISDQVLVPMWVELAEAKLVAGDLDGLWKIYNDIMSKPGALSTETRYRLARHFVDSRHPGFAALGLQLFEQIANQQNITSAEREFHERSLTELANAARSARASSRTPRTGSASSSSSTRTVRKPPVGAAAVGRVSAPARPPRPSVADDATKMRTEALGAVQAERDRVRKYRTHPSAHQKRVVAPAPVRAPRAPIAPAVANQTARARTARGRRAVAATGTTARWRNSSFSV